MLLNGGGGGLGGLGGFGNLNGVLPVIGPTGITGALGTGLVGRRRRSASHSDRTNEYVQLFDSANYKFNK